MSSADAGTNAANIKGKATMNIKVDGNVKATPAMLSHVQTKITHALCRFADRINEVHVHVVDTNGPRGGVDKVCAIHAHVPHLPVVIVSHAASDYYEAVSAAVHRLKASLSRRFARSRHPH